VTGKKGEGDWPVFDEQRILRRIQEGDKRAFEELLDQYESRIYRLALRYTGSVPDAEDLTQEIFLGIYRNIGTFRGASRLSTWVYRVAINHCLQYCRKRRLDTAPHIEEMEMPSTDWHNDPVQVATRQELAIQVESALAQLSPLHRDVILLHEMQGLTYQECAAVLNVPVGTVKSRLSNAFARLRELLGGYVREG
jgi:RNA polymerase sigma-70 factor (ECF subfamily)